MRQSYRVYLYSLLYLSFNFPYLSFAAVKTSQANGNWTNTATWGGTGVPGNNDEVIISTGTIVNLNYAFPANSSLLSLTIEPGGTLIVTANTSTFRIKSHIINDGVLNLWQSNALQADIIFYGNSNWSGTGTWLLSSVNVQNNGWELTPGLSLNINGTIYADAGGSFNKVNRYSDITLYFGGTANSNLPASGSDFFYAHVNVNKTSGTVSFLPSATNNFINLSGNLNLVNSNDRLLINDFNTLTINGSVNGLGSIRGAANSSSLIIDDPTGPVINPLRIAAGDLGNFVVNRTAGVVLQNGFNVRNNLILNNQCRVVLSSETLGLGDNSPPSPGIFSGNGYLVGSSASSISVRGNDPNPTYLRFSQLIATEYTLNRLTIDKLNGITGLADNCNLILTGALDVSDNNIYEIGAATLTLNSVNDFFSLGSLRGSNLSNLVIGGSSLVGYSIRFDQSSSASRSLKSYTQSRRTIVTLSNALDVTEKVSLTGTTSKLASNGNLTLLSSETFSAFVSPLLNSTDITGDVNVQVFITGSTDLSYRGNRSLSTPINDGLITAGNKKSFQQLKDYIIITGSNGTANGFDQGGNAQPFAQTLLYYNEAASAGQSSFTSVNTIDQSLAPGAGVLVFFRGKQMGSYLLNAPKLNAPFGAPEHVTALFKGILNKSDISVTLFNSNQPGDIYNGYNLIGNPYPSAINWTAVTRSAGILDEVIIIKPGGGQATYISGVINNGGSPYIQTGQGFYVRSTVDGSTITFKEVCKTEIYPARLLSLPSEQLLSSANSLKNSETNNADKLNLLRIGLQDNHNTDETTIVFKSDESPLADYHDALYFSGSTVSLSSISENNRKLAVNFMPDLEEVTEIKLAINSQNSGLFKLNFTELPECLASQKIFLKDSLKPDQLTELQKNSSYSFSIDKNNACTFGSGRFSIVFINKKTTIGGPNADPAQGKISLNAYPNPVADQFIIALPEVPLTGIKLFIFDIQGRKVKELDFNIGEKMIINLTGYKPGMYVAEVRSTVDGKVLGRTAIIKN